jgi:glyceraldehyde 3-phosphate dehydrogenase
MKVAIYGFGRIGRLVLRAAIESKRKDLEFVVINDLSSVEMSAFLLQYDSVHGMLPEKVTTEGNVIIVGDKRVEIIAEKDPTKLPWGKMGIDLVMECTGIFTAAEKAKMHLDAGAKRVLVSAPSDGADKTIVYGVNHDTITAKDKIVSNGSCTTNCLAPIAQVLDDVFGIEEGWMTTVHAYTGDQSLVDTVHKDPRRARAAALSMIPSSTGAAKAIGLVLPKLAGKLNGTAVRVPTPDVSLVELVVRTNKPATVEAVNDAMRKAAGGKLAKVLVYNELPLVSIDFTHNPASSIFDATQTSVVGGLLHISSWYDNEWGFSNRMLDVAALLK